MAGAAEGSAAEKKPLSWPVPKTSQPDKAPAHSLAGIAASAASRGGRGRGRGSMAGGRGGVPTRGSMAGRGRGGLGSRGTLRSVAGAAAGGQSFTDLVAQLQKQAKVKKAAGDPEALRRLEEEEEEESRCVRCLECLGKAGLNHLALYLVLVLYAFAGAGLFEWLEEDNELRERAALSQRLNASLSNLTSSILALDGEAGREGRLRELLRAYQAEEGLGPASRRHWDFWGALFYAGTLFTTIGYGHYVPVTRGGQVGTMLYAVLGIPLVLAVLSDLGRLLTRFFKNAYSWVRRLRRWRDRKRWAAGAGDSASYQEWMDSDDLDIPIPVAVLIFFGWIFLCSAVFCIWESEWDFFTAFYFFFISLTTIGLGDVVPDHPRYMIFGCGFVIMGLSLISMVINLIQIKIEQFNESAADFFEEELGWDTESSSGDEDEHGGRPAPSESHPPGASLGIFSSNMARSVSHQSDIDKTKASTALLRKKVTLRALPGLRCSAETQMLCDYVSRLASSLHDPMAVSSSYQLTQSIIVSFPQNINSRIVRNPLNKFQKAADMWKKRAEVDVMRAKRRRKRGIQTEESYLREVSRRFPDLGYFDIPQTELMKSRDDVNSLIETLE